MAVAQVFQQSGFYVVPSTHYQDPDTGKLREIDLTAQRNLMLAEYMVLQVGCTIECKSSPDKPWVLFSSLQRDEDRRDEVFVPYDILGDNILQGFLTEIYDDPLFSKYRQQIEALSLCNPRNMGYGVTQAFTTGNDAPYEAVMRTLKASIARIAGASESTKPNDVPLCSIMFPVVVTDSRLFDCSLDNSGGIVVSEIDHGCIIWRGTHQSISTTPVIHIITRPAIEPFVRLINTTADAIFGIASELQDTLLRMTLAACHKESD